MLLPCSPSHPHPLTCPSPTEDPAPGSVPRVRTPAMSCAPAMSCTSLPCTRFPTSTPAGGVKGTDMCCFVQRPYSNKRSGQGNRAHLTSCVTRPRISGRIGHEHMVRRAHDRMGAWVQGRCHPQTQHGCRGAAICRPTDNCPRATCLTGTAFLWVWQRRSHINCPVV